MGVITIYPRSSRALPYAYFLFVGLSHNFSCCRAFISLSPKPAAPMLSNCLFHGRRQLSHPKVFQNCYNRGIRRITTVGHYATTQSNEECATSNDTPIDASSKWEFAATNIATSEDDPTVKSIRNILVCGDGDLSYSAEMAPKLDRMGIELIATVLEDEDTHNQVYQYSKSNTDIIASSGQKPMFGVDATNLSAYFGDLNNKDDEELTLFDRIQFNFPHWKGKANNKYNRQLVNDFLESAVTVLSPRGEIHVALCDGQGGCSAATLQEWKGSWTASMWAAEHGLLLARVIPYDAQYRLSSHRGVDRPFKLGKSPKLHVFVKPDGVIKAPTEFQLCCRHELHIVIPDDDGVSAVCSLDQILAGDAIESIIQSNCVPEGVRVEVPARQILEIHESHGLSRIAVFLVVYCSESYPVTREMADQWREMVECEVSKYVPLRENRRGRTVSRPFPYPALHPEIKYHTTGER